MQVTTSMHTPAGNAVNPRLDVAAALRGAAQRFRDASEMTYGRPGSASDALYSLLCATSAGASVRFHALGALRLVALGSREAGNLTGTIEGMTRGQLAELCERAAEVA